MRFSAPGPLLLLLLAPAAFGFPSAATVQVAFAQLDHNSDRNLGLVEWDQHALALFRVADRNQDQTLEPDEVPAEADAGTTFDRFDLNRDGQLSRDEFMQLRRALFAVGYINANQQLDAAEYELLRLLAEAGWEDANHDGRLNFGELRANLALIFAHADQNADGALSADEARFLTPTDYAAITAHGPLDVARLHAHYRYRLTGE